jgi:23S rRNA (uracil1939-C5)-methyltransferase
LGEFRLSATYPDRIQAVQLKIEKMIYGGDGLARLPADEHGPGKTVFVSFVLENEEVEAKVTEQKPGFARAGLERVIAASPNRVEPGCPYFQRCGGCNYQHASYKEQVKIKAEILRETLRRTAKVELPCELQIHAASVPGGEWGYRNRTRLKVQTAPEFALGYYRQQSHELLPVENCPISSPLINRAIAAIWERGRAGEIPAAVRELEFFADSADETVLVEAYCAPRTSQQDAESAAEKLAGIMREVKGAVVFELPPANQFVDPKSLAAFGKAAIVYATKLAAYRVSAGAFFQGNRFLIDDLVGIVTGGASGQLALDLYAGVGLFSVPLKESFPQVIAVEASQTSFADLRQNVRQEVKAVRATTAQFLDQASGIKPDLVVADPPRGGLGENVVRKLAGLGAARVTYVSCDPSTLARDLRTLLSLGYQIDGAHMVDLFPQTYHIESVFHLAR